MSTREESERRAHEARVQAVQVPDVGVGREQIQSAGRCKDCGGVIHESGMGSFVDALDHVHVDGCRERKA